MCGGFEVGFRAGRAENIEGALRGLILTPEFGLLSAEAETPGALSYVGRLVAKRREIWTLSTALHVVGGNKDLGQIIEEYSGNTKNVMDI